MEMLSENRPSSERQIDPRRLALVAVHWQKDLLLHEGAFGPIFAAEVERQGLLARMNTLLQAVRSAGGTVIYANVAYNPGHPEMICNSGLWSTVLKTNSFVRGTKGVEVVTELTPQPGDFVQEHSRISAFYGNDLELVLRKKDISTVAVAGVATNVAVDHTVRDALQLGFDTIVVEDCCCSSNLDFHEAALKTLRVLATSVTVAEKLVARFAGVKAAAQ